MTEELSDYSKFAAKPLRFPIGGKFYELAPVGIEDGLILTGAIIDASNPKVPKRKDVELMKIALGSLWDEMAADKVPLPAVIRAGMAAIAEHTYGREFAKVSWETNSDPKAVALHVAGLAEQLKTGNRASRRSSSTAGVKKTPKPASTKATTSRKA